MIAADRYHNDPYFHTLVQMFYREYVKVGQFGGAGLTPTEVREASGLAWQMYVERHALPMLIKEVPSA